MNNKTTRPIAAATHGWLRRERPDTVGRHPDRLPVDADRATTPVPTAGGGSATCAPSLVRLGSAW